MGRGQRDVPAGDAVQPCGRTSSLLYRLAERDVAITYRHNLHGPPDSPLWCWGFDVPA
jgi:hypothetical protein